MMIKLSVVATVLAVVVGFCRCEPIEIPFDNIEFNLFDDQLDSFLDSFVDSANVPKNAEWSDGANDADSDVFAEIASFLSDILATESTLADENSWQKKLDKTVQEEKERENVSNEIRNLRCEISELKKQAEQLNETLLEKSSVGGIEESLFNMIKKFTYGDAPLRKYPTLALPTLFNFAPLISNFAPLLNRYSPDLAKTSRISSTFADALSDFFKPTLMNRLNRIDVNAHPNQYEKHNKYVFTSEIIKKDFQADGYIKTEKSSIKCVQGENGDEGYENFRSLLDGWNFGILPVITTKPPQQMITDVEFSLVKDGLGKDGVYYREENVENGDCAPDYFALVRHRAEKAFGNVLNSVRSTCANDEWPKSRTPTGNKKVFNSQTFP